MCKMNVVINKLVLGNRDLGYETWNGKEIMEYTAKQLKDIILEGKQKVCGLKVGENGELELDREGFFTTNMMIHSHIGNYHSMEEDGMTNKLYVCIGSHEEAGKVVYDCVSSRFEQAAFSENDMRAFLKVGIVSGGAKLDGDKIILAGTELAEPVPEKKEPEPAKADKPKAEPAKEVKAEPEKKEPAVKETPKPEKKTAK